MVREITERENQQGDPWPPDPGALISFLRGDEFRLGSAQALQTVALLERLSVIGRAPCTPEEAANWLAPILCTSLRQQTILLERFKDFAAENKRVSENEEGPPDPIENRPQVHFRNGLPDPEPLHISSPLPQPPAPPPPPRLLGWAFALVGVMALVVIVAWLSRRNNEQRQQVSPTKDTIILDFIRYIDRVLTVQHAIYIFLPLGLVLCLSWLLWIWSRRKPRGVLNRSPYDGQSYATLWPATQLFKARDLSWALQGMRTYRRVPSLQVDARASARATVSASGRPVLVPGWRPRLPEYPILVEALSSHDHVVALARSLAARMTVENVPHTLYMFGGNLRRLRSESDTPVTLGDLASIYNQDILVIVGDGDALIDSVTGKLRASVGELADWNVVVLLTPVSRRRWSWRERYLADEGLLVLPATPEGITMLGAFMRAEGRKPTPALDRAPVRPGLLIFEGRDARLWHSDRIPGKAERERTLDAIALELSPPAFDLVCVLALFPELRPDLTHYASNALRGPDGCPLVDEAGFAAVSALPWWW
jgi:hypothetical protein